MDAFCFACLLVVAGYFVAAVAHPSDGGDSCSSDRDCSFSKTCLKNKCVCKGGYHLHENSCLGGIGSLCKYDEDCIVDSICRRQHTCECMDGLVENMDGTQCTGNVEALGRILTSSCQENYDCEAQYGSAFCETKTHQCQCRPNSHLKNGRCHTSRGLNDSCFLSDECYSKANPDTMDCHPISHMCICKNGTQLSRKGDTCEGAPGRASVNLTSLAALIASYLLAKLLSS